MREGKAVERVKSLNKQKKGEMVFTHSIQLIVLNITQVFLL